MLETLVRPIWKETYLLSRALSSLAFIELFLRMLINKQRERKVVQCIFIRKQPWTIFEQKKERLRLTDLNPRPQGLIGGIENFTGFFKIVSHVSIYFQYIIWYFASALVLNVRYMFYTDKCHLVRTTNIAKFNYNEIPCAYTTFEHGFLLENTTTRK